MQKGTALFDLPDVLELGKKLFLIYHVDYPGNMAAPKQSSPVRPIHIYEYISGKDGNHRDISPSPSAGYALAKGQIMVDSKLPALFRDFLLSS